MSDKHTPGPWIVNGSRIQTDGKDSERTTIARMERGTMDDANARLIAKAPELLELARKVAADPCGCPASVRRCYHEEANDLIRALDA
jgi:hypothetical protein